MQLHNIDAVYDENSEILILGSFPSVKSREQQFFYAHPQNRFWRVLAAVCGDTADGARPAAPRSIEEKVAFLLKNHIALWDVIRSCEISGSSDSSIKNAEPNDLLPLIRASRINRIFCNGKTAFSLYNKLILPKTGIAAQCLPSTSPANAGYSLDRLTNEWRRILQLK